MAAPASRPRTLADWLNHLEPLSPPINPEVRAAALELFTAGASAVELAKQLERDPALVFLLFRDANRALARYDREAHTLEHAVSLLGAGRMQKLFSEAAALDPQHPRADAYRHALLRSQHAAAQARLWAEGSGLWPAEEVFWSTLLAGAPNWLLTLEAGAELTQLGKLRAEQGAVSKRQAINMLGCDVRELGAALTERWLLPQMTRMSWREKGVGSTRQWAQLAQAARLDEPPVISGRELGELCHHPALVVALANALATEADWNWHSHRTLRLLSAAAAACRRPLSTIISFGHQVAAKVSREHALDAKNSGLLTPAARLLCDWNQTYCWVKPVAAQAKITAQNAASNAAPVATTKTGSAERLLAAIVQRLREPAKIGGARAALELAVKALHEGVGFHRVAAIFVRPQNRELQTVLSAGAEQSPTLRQFRYASQNSQLITQLLSKPICLLIDADNREKYWRHFPEDFRAAIDNNNFVVMTAFAKERPVALLYADNASQPVVNGSRQHQLFKQLCQQLSQCLGRLS
jgi:HD-like signal output (HDOD) protein